MKQTYVLILLAFTIVAIAVGMNGNLVAADPCVAQLTTPGNLQFYGSNFQLLVSITATCGFSGGQLYVVGNVLDTSMNRYVSSDYTFLSSSNGGNVYTGQLDFNLPSTVQGDPVQVSVSVFTNAQDRSPISTAVETLQFSSPYPSSGYYSGYYPGYYCYAGYSCAYPYPTYPSYPIYPSPHHSHH